MSENRCKPPDVPGLDPFPPSPSPSISSSPSLSPNYPSFTRGEPDFNAPNLSRSSSANSNSSATSSSRSGSRMPFFEKYSKLVGSSSSSSLTSVSKPGSPVSAVTPKSDWPDRDEIQDWRRHSQEQPREGSTPSDSSSGAGTELAYAAEERGTPDTTPEAPSDPFASAQNSRPFPSQRRPPPLPLSRSTPADLAQGLREDQPFIKQRSQSDERILSNRPVSTRKASNAGVVLDACLDDLMKAMSMDDDSSPRSGEPVFLNISGQADQLTTPKADRRNLRPSTADPDQKSPPARIPVPTRSFSVAELSSRSCFQCRSRLSIRGQPSDILERDGNCFCRNCYASLYLPKCRKCERPIEGKALGSSDGKLKGKVSSLVLYCLSWNWGLKKMWQWHPECFSCTSCSSPFPDRDFYVYDEKPYCKRHYHELNGSLCAKRSCREGIEGLCVSLVGEENGGGGRCRLRLSRSVLHYCSLTIRLEPDHPHCFSCSVNNCATSLDDYHFVLSGLPYCERHANQIVAEEQERKRQAASRDQAANKLNGTVGRSSSIGNSQKRAEKRRTVVGKMPRRR